MKANNSEKAIATREKQLSELQEPIALAERLAKDYSLRSLALKGHLEQAILLSRGIRELRRAVEPFMDDIMALMNDPLGFLTDRDPRRPGKNGPVTPYSKEVVRDCFIQSLLKGLHAVGNEWNIIAGKQYTTREGFERLVRELPGLTDLDVSPGVPRMMGGGAVIPVRATWRYQGKAMMLRNEMGVPRVDIAVRLYAGMGVDAAVGKAMRKVYARIYQKVTGTEHADGDVGDLEFPALSVEEAGRLLDQARERESGVVGHAASSHGQQVKKDLVDAEQLSRIVGLVRELRWEESELLALVAKWNKSRPEELTRQEAEELIIELLDTLRRDREESEAG